MITNVSSLQRLPYASSQRGNGGATPGAGRTGADQETIASTDGNAATQDYKGAEKGTENTKGGKDAKGVKDAKDAYGTDSKGGKRDATGLSEGEREQLKKLKARDTEVRNHENAHQSAGGQFAGSPSYTYQAGPDGRRYAIGGEVSIDVSPEKDPAAIIAKMESIRRATTAPAEPSPQDFKVAAAAQRMMTEAQRDLDAAKLDQMQGKSETDGQSGGTGSENDQEGDKAQAQASSAAAVASAMQAYQSASALARSARSQGGINA
jgi:hypothetical protein